MDSVLNSSLLPSARAVWYAIALLVCWLLFVPGRVHRAVASLPRPVGSLPIIGATHLFMAKYRGRMHLWFAQEARRLEGKPFALDILTRKPIVVLSSVEAMEDVLKHHTDKFYKGFHFTQALENLFGKGIFVTDGPKWIHQRKTASHFFTTQMIREVMDVITVKQAEKLSDMVTEVASQGWIIDIKRLLELFTTDVFTNIGFGVDLEFMTRKNREFFDRFGRANHNALYRQQQPWLYWKAKQLLNVGSERQNAEDVAWLDAFIYRIIRNSIERRERDPHTVRKDVISLCLDYATDEVTDEIDVKEVRDMAMNFISAGRSTTAYSMAWFMLMMAQHPHVQTRIREELWAKVPELMRGDVKAPNRDMTMDLTYLEACIKENLRLNTVVPLNTREATEDVTLSDGTFIPKGTQVMLSAYGMSRLPEVWGPDADQYKPERWIDRHTGKLLPMSPFKFITFSAGRRICPGKHFALMEMKIALASLLSKVEIHTVEDPFSFDHDCSLALSIQGPIYIRPTLVPRTRI